LPGYVEGKDKNQILNALVGTGQPGSPVHEQQKMGIVVRCTEDLEKAIGSLEKSMNLNASSSDRLAAKVYWLNVILAIATAIGAIATIAQLFIRR
jgi:hypothetical protein